MSQHGTAVEEPPSDGITAVRFADTTITHLLAASWDGVSFIHFEQVTAVLVDLSFQRKNVAYTEVYTNNL